VLMARYKKLLLDRVRNWQRETLLFNACLRLVLMESITVSLYDLLLFSWSVIADRCY
jgi:hypothetical protein